MFSHGLRKPRRQGPVIAPQFIANSVRNRRHLTAARATPPAILLKGKSRRRQTAAVNALGLAIPKARRRIQPGATLPQAALRGHSRRRHVPGSGLAGATKVLQSRRAHPNRIGPIALATHSKRRRLPPTGQSSLPKIFRRRKNRVYSIIQALPDHSKRRRVPGLGQTAAPLAPKRKKAHPQALPPAILKGHTKRRPVNARPPEGPGPYPLRRRMASPAIPPAAAIGPKQKKRNFLKIAYVSPIVPGPFEVVASQISFAGSVMGDVVAQAIVQGTLVKSRRCHTGRQPAPPNFNPRSRRHGQRGSMVPNR